MIKVMSAFKQFERVLCIDRMYHQSKLVPETSQMFQLAEQRDIEIENLEYRKGLLTRKELIGFYELTELYHNIEATL